MHFVSTSAARVVSRQHFAPLVKDHAIPLKCLYELLLRDGEDRVDATLENYYRVAILTKDEHDELEDIGLKDTMPAGWDGDDLFARYHEADIFNANRDGAN